MEGRLGLPCRLSPESSLGWPARCTLPVRLVLGAAVRGEQDMTLGGSQENQEVASSPSGCDRGNVSSIHLGRKSDREFLGPVGHSN